jgi:hypothetical protein
LQHLQFQRALHLPNFNEAVTTHPL